MLKTKIEELGDAKSELDAILGLDNLDNRSNRPEDISKKCSGILRDCIDNDCWTEVLDVFANKGLILRAHVLDEYIPIGDNTDGNSDRTVVVPKLSLSSLWASTVIDVLDLKHNSTDDRAASSGKSSSSFDQQKTLSERGFGHIQNFLLVVMRIAIRDVLSRQDVTYCKIDMDAFNHSHWLPPASSVKNILQLDFVLIADELSESLDTLEYFVAPKDSGISPNPPEKVMLGMN